MEKAKTVRMRFIVDMFYNDLEKPYYLKNQIYDVPESMVLRWLKRGGELVDSHEPASGAGSKVESKEVVEPPKEVDKDEDKDLDDSDLEDDADKKPQGRGGKDKSKKKN